MTELPDVSSFKMAQSLLEDSARWLGCSEVKQLREVGYPRILMEILPGLEAITDGERRVYYRVSNELAEQLAIVGIGNRPVFEVVKEICISNIWNGEPVPKPLRAMCTGLILGEQVAPRGTGRVPGKNFTVQYVATRIIQYLSDAYGIDKTRNEGSPPMSATDIVKEAMASFGMCYDFKTVRDWTKRGKNKDFTLWSDALIDLESEEVLFAAGAIKTRRHRILNPWGQFAPMHLSTKPKHND